MKLDLLLQFLLRIVRVGAALFAIAFLALGSWLALGEPTGFDHGMWASLTGSQDLFMRHNEVRMMLHGENPYRLLRDGWLEQRGLEVLGPGHHMDPDYFPSTLLPVWLMAWLPFEWVKALWLLASLGSIVLLVLVLRWCMDKEAPSPANQGLMVSFWICGVPASCLAMGQASLFSVALTLAAWRADHSGRPWLAGLLLALGVFKYALVWPLVLFLFILQWRWLCLLVGGGIHLVVHLAVCSHIKADPVSIFGDVLAGNANITGFSTPPTFSLPFRLWNQLFPHAHAPAAGGGVLLLIMVLAALGSLWMRRTKEDRHGLLLWIGVLLMVSVLTVPTRLYAHMFGLPVLLYACAPASRVQPWQRGLLIAAVLWLAHVPSGIDDLGLAAWVQTTLLAVFRLGMFSLAAGLGWLLLKSERTHASKAEALSH
jgi:hypothetical protein